MFELQSGRMATDGLLSVACTTEKLGKAGNDMPMQYSGIGVCKLVFGDHGHCIVQVTCLLTNLTTRQYVGSRPTSNTSTWATLRFPINSQYHEYRHGSITVGKSERYAALGTMCVVHRASEADQKLFTVLELAGAATAPFAG